MRKRSSSTLNLAGVPELVQTPVSLPVVRGTNPVLKALRLRRTTREISARPLSAKTMSELLWAAYGVNRKSGPFGLPGRTAASASNSQEIDLYVALPDGMYLYKPIPHQLVPIAAGDHRSWALSPGQPDSGSRAPLRLIYVADVERLRNSAGYQEPGLHEPNVQRSYYYVATGLIAANVYLYAAAAGLAAWFHNCDRRRLGVALRLNRSQRVLFAQTIGYAAGTRRRGTSR